MSSLQQPAIILQHRSAPVRLDPPSNEDSVRAAVIAANAERAAVNDETGLNLPMFPDPADHFKRVEQMDVIDAFGRLLEHHSYGDLSRWLRFAGHLKGVA